MCDHVWIFEARTLSTQPVRRRCGVLRAAELKLSDLNRLDGISLPPKAGRLSCFSRDGGRSFLHSCSVPTNKGQCAGRAFVREEISGHAPDRVAQSQQCRRRALARFSEPTPEALGVVYDKHKRSLRLSAAARTPCRRAAIMRASNNDAVTHRLGRSQPIEFGFGSCRFLLGGCNERRARKQDHWRFDHQPRRT
jgi:hypothetical protein